MVNSHRLPARVIANLAIWGVLFEGAFFVLVYKDWTMSMNLAILMICKLGILLILP